VRFRKEGDLTPTARVGCRSRVARIVLTAALLTLVAACGRPEPSPETIFEPDGVDLIASADPTNELLRYTLESGAKLKVRRDGGRTLESTGRAEPGDLLAHGAADGEQWLAVFGSLDPPQAAVGPAWVAVAPRLDRGRGDRVRVRAAAPAITGLRG